MSAGNQSPIGDDDTIYAERPGGFEQVPDALWHPEAAEKIGAATVSDGAVMMYLALAKRGSREDRGVPKRKTLAKDVGKSVRTVDARLDELVEKGWLLITPRFRQNGDEAQTTNHYRLLWTPIQGETDERLAEHQRQRAMFEAGMRARQETNERKRAKEAAAEVDLDEVRRGRDTRITSFVAPAQDSARGGRRILHGGGAESCTGPVQEVARQEPDLLETTPSKNHTPHTPPLAAASGDEPAVLFGEVPTKAKDEAVEPVPTFEDFYAIYPRHAGRADAKKAWGQVLRAGADPAAILAGARRFAADPNLPPPAEARYIKHPATWLRAGSWDDDPEPPRLGRAGSNLHVDPTSDPDAWGNAAHG